MTTNIVGKIQKCSEFVDISLTVPPDNDGQVSLTHEVMINIHDCTKDKEATVNIDAPFEIKDAMFVQACGEKEFLDPEKATETHNLDSTRYVTEKRSLRIVGPLIDGLMPVVHIRYTYDQPASATNRARR